MMTFNTHLTMLFAPCEQFADSNLKEKKKVLAKLLKVISKTWMSLTYFSHFQGQNEKLVFPLEGFRICIISQVRVRLHWVAALVRVTEAPCCSDSSCFGQKSSQLVESRGQALMVLPWFVSSLPSAAERIQNWWLCDYCYQKCWSSSILTLFSCNFAP